MDHLLSLVIFSPIFGAVIMGIFLRGDSEDSDRNAKLLALVTTVATLILNCTTE